MPAAAKKLATYDDVLAAPQDRVAELVAGELYTQARPAPQHALVGSSLGSELFGRFHRGDGGPGGWVILFEPELHLAANVLVPDLAGWRRERMSVLPEEAYFELAPDFCCEILSPASARFDRAVKLPIYAAQGVSHVWLVDPVTQTLEIFALDGASYRLHAVHASDEVVAAPPFEQVPLQLARLWNL